ncbi:MAG: hypothetical protein AB1798_17015 [Spirochaetota bacterium]
MRAGILFIKRIYTSLALAALVCFLPPHSLALGNITSDSSIDWENGTLTINARADLSSSGINLLNARNKAELAIDQRLVLLLRDALFPVPVDSYTLVKDLVQQKPELLDSFESIAAKGRKVLSHLTRDLAAFTVQYVYSLYPDIITPFLEHHNAFQPPRLLGFEPTNQFSGIVIYMKGEFPVYGENKKAGLIPCFFPKIFDQDMNLVASAEMTSTEAMLQWGFAAYTSSLDEKPYSTRIGLTPLRTLGIGIFGKNKTDIIIPNETARKILASEKNLDLIRKGKILVICDLEKTKE